MLCCSATTCHPVPTAMAAAADQSAVPTSRAHPYTISAESFEQLHPEEAQWVNEKIKVRAQHTDRQAGRQTGTPRIPAFPPLPRRRPHDFTLALMCRQVVRPKISTLLSQQLNLTLDEGDKVPRIAISVSGGGKRSLLNGAGTGALTCTTTTPPKPTTHLMLVCLCWCCLVGTGVLSGLSSAGVMDISTWIGGLSGGGWLISALHVRHTNIHACLRNPLTAQDPTPDAAPSLPPSLAMVSFLLVRPWVVTAPACRMPSPGPSRCRPSCASRSSTRPSRPTR